MATEMYKANDEIMQIMRDLVSQYHPDLIEIVGEIAIVFRDKAAKKGGRAVLGKVAKASPLFGVLGETEWKFILELPADEWENLTTKQRQADIDHLLCACRGEEDEKTGDMKYFLAPPDVEFYYDELDRWGDWRPRPEDDDREGSSVEEIFGKRDPAEA